MTNEKRNSKKLKKTQKTQETVNKQKKNEKEKKTVVFEALEAQETSEIQVDIDDDIDFIVFDESDELVEKDVKNNQEAKNNQNIDEDKINQKIITRDIEKTHEFIVFDEETTQKKEQQKSVERKSLPKLEQVHEIRKSKSILVSEEKEEVDFPESQVVKTSVQKEVIELVSEPVPEDIPPFKKEKSYFVTSFWKKALLLVYALILFVFMFIRTLFKELIKLLVSSGVYTSMYRSIRVLTGLVFLNALLSFSLISSSPLIQILLVFLIVFTSFAEFEIGSQNNQDGGMMFGSGKTMIWHSKFPFVYVYSQEEKDEEVTISFPYKGSFTETNSLEQTNTESKVSWSIKVKGSEMTYNGEHIKWLFYEGSGFKPKITSQGWVIKCINGKLFFLNEEYSLSEFEKVFHKELVRIGLFEQEANDFIEYCISAYQIFPNDGIYSLRLVDQSWLEENIVIETIHSYDRLRILILCEQVTSYPDLILPFVDGYQKTKTGDVLHEWGIFAK